jgi:hypothetical protein
LRKHGCKRQAAGRGRPVRNKGHPVMVFDFRKIQISLPENKFIAWTTHANKLITTGTTTAKELELIIGPPGHLALVVPGVHHFLSHL